MKTRTLLTIGVSIVILAVIAAGVWWEMRPQIINFDDGSKLTLLKVDYGKQHKPPQVKGARAGTRSINTTNDTLVLWVHQQYDSHDWHNFQYYLYDRDGAACVAGQGRGYSGRGNEIVGVEFSAFPRRGSRFYVRAQENGNGGQDMSDDKFIVSNPARGQFTAWVPQPLPDTEEDGDFSATLKKLVACAKMPFTRNGNNEDNAINKGVQATFHAELNGTNASDWQPVAVETFDATGNSVTGWLNAQPQGDDMLASYQYGLWPDEPAWKLRVEFSQQANFNNSELWKISEIPLQPGRQQDFWNYGGRRRKTTPAFAEQDLGGLHILLYPIRQFTNMPPNSQPQGGMIIEVQPPLPEGTRLTIVKLTDDQANDIQYWNYGEGSSAKSQSFRYGLQNLDGVTNVNLTLAVHQSHFVEFTVKPEIQAAQAASADTSQSLAGRAAAFVASLWMHSPQVISLEDGTKLTLVGVDYGKHHVFKGVKTTGSHLQGRMTLDTTNDTLMAWIESEKPHGQDDNQSQWPQYQLMTYDSADTACVASWRSTGQQIKSGVYVQGFTINAFPRRERKIILRIAAWGNNGLHLTKGQFVISNPGSRSFSQWQPEPMPDTQSDGDLDVTLTRCVAGVPSNMYGPAGTDPKDPMHKGVSVSFQTEQYGKAVTNWQPVAIETSDATGNQVGLNGWSTSRDDNGDPTMTYQWGLWPDESAWKLRVEMSRTSGFTNSEIWTVTNVPVGKGTWNELWNFQMRRRFMNGFQQNGQSSSPPFAETTLNDIHLKLYPAIQITDQNFGMGQKQGGFHIAEDSDIPDGYRLSLVEATDERGRKLQSWGPNSQNGNSVFQLPDIGNAKFLNLTIALHKSRFVEFTVKPTKQ